MKTLLLLAATAVAVATKCVNHFTEKDMMLETYVNCLENPVNFRAPPLTESQPIRKKRTMAVWVEESFNWYRWKDGIVPYNITCDFNTCQRAHIYQAMQRFNETCIQFVPAKDNHGYDFVMQIVMNDTYFGPNARGEYSYITDHLTLHSTRSFTNLFTVMHELYHGLGFSHEFERSDRVENPKRPYGHLTTRSPYGQHALLTFGPFDPQSISMYTGAGFKSDEDRPVLSESDVWRINKYYKCNHTITGLPIKLSPVQPEVWFTREVPTFSTKAPNKSTVTTSSTTTTKAPPTTTTKAAPTTTTSSITTTTSATTRATTTDASDPCSMAHLAGKKLNHVYIHGYNRFTKTVVDQHVYIEDKDDVSIDIDIFGKMFNIPAKYNQKSCATYEYSNGELRKTLDRHASKCDTVFRFFEIPTIICLNVEEPKRTTVSVPGKVVGKCRPDGVNVAATYDSPLIDTTTKKVLVSSGASGGVKDYIRLYFDMKKQYVRYAPGACTTYKYSPSENSIEKILDVNSENCDAVITVEKTSLLPETMCIQIA